MISWNERTREEKSLLNPCFTSNLLWHSASGHQEATDEGMPLELAFLILPIILRESTRSSLPSTVRTSLAVWLDNNPLSISEIARRSRLLVPHSREAILFGGLHGLLSVTSNCLIANADLRLQVGRSLRSSSEEVKACAKKAKFLGKWLGNSGGAPTVLALLGVQP